MGEQSKIRIKRERILLTKIKERDRKIAELETEIKKLKE